MDCSPPGSSVHAFSRQQYWNRAPFPPPGDLPSPGIELMSLVSPALPGRFFTTRATCETQLGLCVTCVLSLSAVSMEIFNLLNWKERRRSSLGSSSGRVMYEIPMNADVRLIVYTKILSKREKSGLEINIKMQRTHSRSEYNNAVL